MIRVVAMALCCCVAIAGAEEKPAAQVLLDRGLRSYAVGKWAEAIEAFRAGYEIEPRPDFLYALAQAERMSGDCRAAAAAYRAFLRTSPAEKAAGSARQNLERCEAQVAAEPATTSAPPVATPAVKIDVAPRRAWYSDPAGDVLGALGLAIVGTGGALWGVGEAGVQSANAATRYDQFGGGAGAERERTVGIVGVAVGGALMLGAVGRWIWVARHR